MADRRHGGKGTNQYQVRGTARSDDAAYQSARDSLSGMLVPSPSHSPNSARTFAEALDHSIGELNALTPSVAARTIGGAGMRRYVELRHSASRARLASLAV